MADVAADALVAYRGRLPEEEEEGEAHGGNLWWFRDRRLSAGIFFILWGACGIILGAVPDLSANPDHVLLSFSFLTVGAALLVLTVAAPHHPMAARLEGWLMEML